MEQNRRILIIDDNRAIHEDFRKILCGSRDRSALEASEAALFGESTVARRTDYEIESAYQGQEGVEAVRRSLEAGRPLALAFVDMRMPPGWDGLKTIEELWKVDAEIQIVMCSAYSDFSWEEITDRLGATDRLLILKKPFDTAEVCQLACALTEKWQLAKHAHLKLNQLHSMVEEHTRYLRDANRQLSQETEDRRRSEMALRASEDRYALAAAGSNDGLWDADLVEGTVYYSPRWKELLGHAEHEVHDKLEEWLSRVHPDDAQSVRSALDGHLEGHSPHFTVEHRLRHRNGHYLWMLCRGLAVRDDTGRAVRIAGSLSDITQRRLAEEQLRHDAHHDALTGLPNRVLLTERLGRALLRAKRDQEWQFAVLFLDLDRFKVVNDTLGHLVGDQLLVDMSQHLASSVRATDTVALNERHCLARLGGDEFVLLLEGIRNPTDAIRVADRLLESLKEPFEIDGHELFSSASIGIAVSDARYSRPEEMLRDADTALYRAKGAGRARYQLFDPKMHSESMARWELENELRRAIDNGELLLEYQPILSLETRRITEVETLVRWRHSTRGVIPPAEFIPLAEETGLIVPLGYWVLREACHQFRRSQARVPEARDWSIAVNVSGRQFAEPDFVERVSEILRETGVDPKRVRLEITESAMMDGAAVRSRIEELQRLELQFHLDDFGTGYSSLSYLHQIPIQALKIDRSFVSAIEKNALSRSVVQAIVTLAHTMGMQVIAEGVETTGQLGALKLLRCDYAQGYLFSRPVAAAAVEELLRGETQQTQAESVSAPVAT